MNLQKLSLKKQSTQTFLLKTKAALLNMISELKENMYRQLNKIRKMVNKMRIYKKIEITRKNPINSEAEKHIDCIVKFTRGFPQPTPIDRRIGYLEDRSCVIIKTEEQIFFKDIKESEQNL